MKFQKWLGVGVLGAGLMLAGAAQMAWAGPGMGDGHGKMEKMDMDDHGPDGDEGGMMGHHMMGKLNLTAEQIAKLKAERMETRKQMVRDMAEVKVMHMDLADETMSDKPDQGKIEKIIRQITERQAQMMMQRTKSVMLLRSILTPEQKKIMDEMHLQMWGGPGGMMSGGRHMGHDMKKDCADCPKTKK